MDRVSEKLTIFFDDPFWIGVLERVSDGKLSVCRVTFGAEPKDYEVWEFFLRHYRELKFSGAVEIEEKRRADNPKRRQKNAARQLKKTGIGTRSQQALKLQHEQNKLERRVKSREQRLSEGRRNFELKQQKKKEKHRGK